MSNSKKTEPKQWGAPTRIESPADFITHNPEQAAITLADCELMNISALVERADTQKTKKGATGAAVRGSYLMHTVSAIGVCAAKVVEKRKEVEQIKQAINSSPNTPNSFPVVSNGKMLANNPKHVITNNLRDTQAALNFAICDLLVLASRLEIAAQETGQTPTVQYIEKTKSYSVKLTERLFLSLGTQSSEVAAVVSSCVAGELKAPPIGYVKIYKSYMRSFILSEEDMRAANGGYYNLYGAQPSQGVYIYELSKKEHGAISDNMQDLGGSKKFNIAVDEKGFLCTPANRRGIMKLFTTNPHYSAINEKV